jgi:DNA polymerase I-like protein with 3'-5' exonuclease and polymerase domains
MELTGLGFDPDKWGEVVAIEEALIPKLENDLQLLLSESFTFDLFGGTQGTVNLNSPLQLLAALHRIGIEVDSTNESTLKKCGNVGQKILDYREHVNRLKWDYPQFINPVTKRIHPDYNQLGANTGRFSCSDPNLQQVPHDPVFRRMFVAPKDYVYITADYSQQELRVLAELCEDPNLVASCKSADPHLENARMIYSDQTILKKDDRRRVAKTAGFALVYGAGVKTFAAGSGLPVKEAGRVHKLLHRTYPLVDTWGDESWKDLVAKGYISTIGGRRRYFPGAASNPGKYITVARNSPVQGSSADMMKLAVLYVAEAVQDMSAYPVLCVHDEIVCQVPKHKASKIIKEVIEEQMIKAGEYYVKSVPTVVESAIAETWSK